LHQEPPTAYVAIASSGDGDGDGGGAEAAGADQTNPGATAAEDATAGGISSSTAKRNAKTVLAKRLARKLAAPATKRPCTTTVGHTADVETA
jgi:hypothetical protein